MLDGHGGFTSYGVIENSETSCAEQLLPMGLTEGCALKKDIKKDEVLTLNDVEFPKGRLLDQLWEEQNHFFGLDRCLGENRNNSGTGERFSLPTV